MRVKVWGARGSVPAPGPDMNRYGGNTSCVQVTLSTGEELILDAGTGIRALGLRLLNEPQVNILLTHLHHDHIQGLMFFPPCFRSESAITVWGPASPEATLESRIARYISAPLSPVEVRELPCEVCFRDTPASEWTIGGATIRAEAVTHRGPTLGYRVTEGDTSVCYIPDHEPALGDTLTFARRTRARRLMLFHHDPLHGDDFLDRLHIHAQERFGEAGGDPTRVEMGIEGAELELTGTSSTARTTVATEVSTPG